MDIINITEAKAQLSAVIEKVVSTGEDVLIGKAGKPVVKITRYEPAKNNCRLGLLRGQIKVKPDFDEWPEDMARILGIKDE